MSGVEIIIEVSWLLSGYGFMDSRWRTFVKIIYGLKS